MPPVRRLVLAGVLAGAVVLAGGCSDPAPAETPGTPGGAVTTPGAVTSAPPTSSAATTPGATPGAESSSATTEPSAEGEPSVEPSRPLETAPPKKLDQPTRTAGAVVSLESVRATTVKASTPGERSGRGVLVRLRLRNSSSTTLDAAFVQVGVTDPTGTAAILVDGPPTERVTPSVRPGRTVEGTYAFVTDDRPTDVVTVSVYVTEGQPVVTFRGRPS